MLGESKSSGVNQENEGETQVFLSELAYFVRVDCLYLIKPFAGDVIGQWALVQISLPNRRKVHN